MTPKYKLTYFPVTGLGEPIRFLLAYGNIEFEDYRFEWNEWPAIKPDMPFGKVPVLEIDGKMTHQSGAICRYLAKKMNLNGRNARDSLQIDMIVDTMADLRIKFADFYYDRDEERRAAKLEPLLKETVPFFFSRFDKFAEQNGGYLVGGQLTWADFMLAAMVDYMNRMVGTTLFADYPNLQRMKENVVSIPQIKAWIEKRPPDIMARN